MIRATTISMPRVWLRRLPDEAQPPRASRQRDAAEEAQALRRREAHYRQAKADAEAYFYLNCGPSL